MKREVKIVGLSYAQSQIGSYIVVLSETNGFRKLPVIVKTPEAQQIALKLENMESPRPVSHDIIKSICNGFNLDCQESYIYDVVEGVFYSRIILSDGIDTVEVETSCGDAIISSLNFECPLYIDEEVLSTCGILTDEDGEVVPEDQETTKERTVSVEELRKMMDDAVRAEDYELAGQLRDRIASIEG